MAAETPRLRNAPVTKALVKVVVYYVILIAIGAVVWDALPHAGGFAESFDLLSGTAAPPPDASAKAARLQVGELNLAVTVALAMISAILLSIPIAWVYVLTRAKKGYQQSRTFGSGQRSGCSGDLHSLQYHRRYALVQRLRTLADGAGRQHRREETETGQAARSHRYFRRAHR